MSATIHRGGRQSSRLCPRRINFLLVLETKLHGALRIGTTLHINMYIDSKSLLRDFYGLTGFYLDTYEGLQCAAVTAYSCEISVAPQW